MKKITILALALGTCTIAQAQVLSNGLISKGLFDTNYFLDASNFQGQADASKGKLLGFPQTDLTQFKFDLNVVTDEVTLSGFDGVVVYNTATGKTGSDANTQGKVVDVTPGFYYFSNPNGATNQTVSEGQWVRLSDTQANRQIWFNDPVTKIVKIKSLSDGITERKDENNIFINDEGKVSIGTSEDFFGTPKLRVYNFDNDTSTGFSVGAYQMVYSRFQNSVNGAMLLLRKGRGNDSNSREFIQSGDNLGRIRFSPEYVSADLTGKGPIEIDGAYINVRATEVVDEEHFSTAMEFATRSKNASQSYITMRLSDTGFLGIGVPSPAERLDVEGNIRATSLVGQGNRTLYADDNGIIRVGNIAYANASLWNDDTVNNKVVLSANPNVTIDKTTGELLAGSFKGINGASIFPDYVFQKYYTGTSSLKADYSFKTLSQVENFVKTNGHLPGYKSAAEIKKQGYIDLMATQLTNVEKIEELYLHSIEQEKKIEAQQKQIEELKSLVQELLKK
ncbi:hypothetical protein PG623_10220 [Riemerella anatipestifer]|nr:hypothetical protein [Riemerella anatipestifer]